MTSSFKEGRKIVHIAKRAGLTTREERRNTLLGLRDADPEVRRVLTAQGASAFLDRIEPSTVLETNKPVLQFGAALFSLEERLRKGDATLREGDIVLLNRITDIFEANLFNGNLATAAEERGATLAFIANRVGKIQEQTHDPRLRSLDAERFRALAAEVNTFAEDELSEARLNQRLAQKERDLEQEFALREHSNDVDVTNYNSHDKEARAAEAEVREILASGRIDKDFKEMAGFLTETYALLRKSHDLPGVAMIAGCLEIVRDFLSKRDGNGVAEYFLKNTYQSMPFLEMLKGQSAPRGGTDNQGTLLKRHLQADSCLRAYLDERTPAKAASSGGKVKGLAGLQILDPEDRIPKLRRAQEILFGWLYGELPGAFQELVTARRKGLGARQAQRETERRLEKNPDFIASKKRIAVLEQELLLLERTRNQLPAMRNAFARSQATLLRDIDHPQDKSTLYFIKSFCVAADRADLVEQRHGHPLFEAISTISGPEIQSHQFLAYEHRGELNNGNKKYSDIHYRTIDLPFCLMLVEYFKSLRPEGFKARPARTPIAGKFERALPEYWD